MKGLKHHAHGGGAEVCEGGAAVFAPGEMKRGTRRVVCDDDRIELYLAAAPFALSFDATSIASCVTCCSRSFDGGYPCGDGGHPYGRTIPTKGRGRDQRGYRHAPDNLSQGP